MPGVVGTGLLLEIGYRSVEIELQPASRSVARHPQGMDVFCWQRSQASLLIIFSDSGLLCSLEGKEMP